MYKSLITLLLVGKLFCLANEAERIDQEAIDWLKNHLRERLASEDLFKNSLQPENSSFVSKSCKTCHMDLRPVEEGQGLYVFVSFSLGDPLWTQLSKQVEKVGGILVLRGLPKNSFQELSIRLSALQKKGVHVPIQIHPTLFQKYQVETVPCFVVAEEGSYDKISGNISLKYALEKMAQKGETDLAKILYQSLKKEDK